MIFRTIIQLQEALKEANAAHEKAKESYSEANKKWQLAGRRLDYSRNQEYKARTVVVALEDAITTLQGAQ